MNRHHIAAFLASVTLLQACASIEKKEHEMDVHGTEALLSAAGFKAVYANSEKELVSIELERQQKIQPQIINGKTAYVFADAEFCKCRFIGDEANYSEFQKLLAKANENRKEDIMDIDEAQ